MFRVPVVDLVGWIRASFKPADQVVLKIDVEGVEHEIFEALTQGGGWDPELTRTLRGLRVGYVYGLRVPASRVGYVPEAQGGLPPQGRAYTVSTCAVGTRTSHGRTVSTAYRGTPGGTASTCSPLSATHGAGAARVRT